MLPDPPTGADAVCLLLDPSSLASWTSMGYILVAHACDPKAQKVKARES